MKIKTLSPELLHEMDVFWRAANYLSVGQLFLYDNVLLDSGTYGRGQCYKCFGLKSKGICI